MQKFILSCLILTSYFLLHTSPILADDEIRKMVVDVKLKGFTQSTYQDNLESKDIIFAPNDKFQLELKITNQGNRNQTNIKITPKVPSDATIDTSAFILNQLTPNETYTKNIVVTVKDKPYVLKALTANTIRFDITTDVKTTAGDYATFFTSGGTKVASTATSSAKTLPATGANIFIGSSIASLLGFASLKLRKVIRGY